jgi:hypothetical protein
MTITLNTANEVKQATDTDIALATVPGADALASAPRKPKYQGGNPEAGSMNVDRTGLEQAEVDFLDTFERLCIEAKGLQSRLGEIWGHTASMMQRHQADALGRALRACMNYHSRAEAPKGAPAGESIAIEYRVKNLLGDVQVYPASPESEKSLTERRRFWRERQWEQDWKTSKRLPDLAAINSDVPVRG